MIVEIEDILISRVKYLRQEKVHLKSKIETFENKLQELKHFAGTPPRESEQEIQQQIFILERIHSTTSQTKSEERTLLREIEKLKQKKKASATYGKFGGEMEELRKLLNATRVELLEKEEALDELAFGLRKVRLAARTGSNTEDFVENSIHIDEDKIPLIIGKGGMTVCMIEETYGVGIDIDHVKGRVYINGTPDGIEKALVSINTLLDTVSDEFSISTATIAVLTMDRNALLHQLQNDHCVQLDLNLTKSQCKLTGLSNAVKNVKTLIISIPSARSELKVDKNLFSAIIGKGGANIRTLCSNLCVQLNISRDEDIIEIVGLKSDVNFAVQRLKQIVEDTRDVEESICAERYIVLGGVLPLVRIFSKENRVKIDVEGCKDDKMYTLTVKGANAKVQLAIPALKQLVEDYRSQIVSLEVPDDVIPAILGKGGGMIKEMREKFVGCNIDIENSVVHVHSKDVVLRDAVMAQLYSIIKENYVESLSISEDFAVMLKSDRAVELRDRITRTLDVRLNIDKTNCEVKLKGLQSKVRNAVEMLRLLQLNYVSKVLSVSEEDYPLLLKNGDEGSIVRDLSDKFNVDITAHRKNLTLSIRGHPTNVDGAINSLQGLLEGNERYGSHLMRLDEILSSAFIGKSGTNVKKLEEELNVKFDLLKSRSSLRIRGNRDNVFAARIAVTKFFLAVRISAHVDCPYVLEKPKLDALARELYDIFNAELEVTPNNILVLRCSYQVITEAKLWLKSELSGVGTFSLPLLPSHVEALRKMPNYGLPIQNDFAVSLSASSIDITANRSKLMKTKKDILCILHGLFPNETAFIELFRVCLRNVVSADFLVNMECWGGYLCCDYAASVLWLICPSEHLTAAQAAVEQSLIAWKELNSVFPIEEFMISQLIGKGGASINAIRKDLSCEIDIDRTSLCICVKAPSRGILEKASTFLHSLLAKFRAEHWETRLHPALVPVLIGKQGSNINKFRSETGVEVDIDPKTGIIKLHGPEDKIPEAQRKMQQFIEDEEKYRTLPRIFHVPATIVAALIGPKGVAIKALQDESGAKINLDRESKKCVLRGKNEDCERAFNMINDILLKEGYKAISRTCAVADKEETVANETIVNASLPDRVSIPKPHLSKSSLKRLRKKQRQQPSNDGEKNADIANEIAKPIISMSSVVSVQSPLDTTPFRGSDTFSSLDKCVGADETLSSRNPQHLIEFLLGKKSSDLLVPPKEAHFIPLPPPGLVAPNAPSIGLTSYRSFPSSANTNSHDHSMIDSRKPT